MSSMMETLHIRRKSTSLPVSQRSNSSTVGDDESSILRSRRFPRSNSVSAIGEKAGSSVKEWWGWGWSWILSRKPIFFRDLEFNKDEAKSIGFGNRGSIMHVFFKLRTQIRNLMDPSSDSLPLSSK